MNSKLSGIRMRRSIIASTVAGVGALLMCSTPVFAANESATARDVYSAERAQCMSAPADSDRAACLQSAGAALQAARAGQLDTADHPFEENAIRRCDVFEGSDREDCMARVRGEGTVTGSVEAGGIVRELKTVQLSPNPPISNPGPTD